MRHLATLTLLLLLAGCGQTGPLYMPDNPAPGQAEEIAGGKVADDSQEQSMPE